MYGWTDLLHIRLQEHLPARGQGAGYSLHQLGLHNPPLPVPCLPVGVWKLQAASSWSLSMTHMTGSSVPSNKQYMTGSTVPSHKQIANAAGQETAAARNTLASGTLQRYAQDLFQLQCMQTASMLHKASS